MLTTAPVPYCARTAQLVSLLVKLVSLVYTNVTSPRVTVQPTRLVPLVPPPSLEMASPSSEMLQSNPEPRSAACCWRGEPCLLGIDEAGRGPVLGPMVYASAFCAVSKHDELKTCAFADSKTLTEEKREGLFEGIKTAQWLGYHVEELSARQISHRMLHPVRESLNKLANEATFSLIRRALDEGVNLVEVFVDTVGDADRLVAPITPSEGQRQASRRTLSSVYLCSHALSRHLQASGALGGNFPSNQVCGLPESGRDLPDCKRCIHRCEGAPSCCLLAPLVPSTDSI